MFDLAVIMSVYEKDRIEYVKESIESILVQTFSFFNFYIVLDGPVSKEIESYIFNISDIRLKVFRIKINGGLASALNFLLEIVLKDPDCKYIARMDADDISFPARFEKQRFFLQENSLISVVGCWYNEIDETGRVLSDRKLPVDHESLKNRYFTRTPFAHSSVMYKRVLIEKAGFYPTNTFLMEDNALWGNALKSGLEFANIPEFLIKFRIDNGFFKRRSGLRYGMKYIITKLKIYKLLNAPLYRYLFLIIIGITKMMPSFVLKNVYSLNRKLYKPEI